VIEPAPTDDVAALVKSMRAAADEVHYDTVELLTLAADALERLAADLAAARHALAMTHATMTRAQGQVAAVRALADEWDAMPIQGPGVLDPKGPAAAVLDALDTEEPT